MILYFIHIFLEFFRFYSIFKILLKKSKNRDLTIIHTLEKTLCLNDLCLIHGIFESVCNF